MSEYYGVWFIGDTLDGTVYTGEPDEAMWSIDKSLAMPLNACQALDTMEDVDCSRWLRNVIMPLPWHELKDFKGCKKT
jgi:hypothetical protein